jgi:hypothetical protein
MQGGIVTAILNCLGLHQFKFSQLIEVKTAMTNPLLLLAFACFVRCPFNVNGEVTFNYPAPSGRVYNKLSTVLITCNAVEHCTHGCYLLRSKY